MRESGYFGAKTINKLMLVAYMYNLEIILLHYCIIKCVAVNSGKTNLHLLIKETLHTFFAISSNKNVEV